MNFVQFKNEINDKKEYFCYVLAGEDAFFRRNALELIKTAFLTEPDLNLASFSGENLDFNALVSSVNSYPFLSEKRVTVLSEFYPDKNLLKKFKELFVSPSSSAILVINNSKEFEGFSSLDNAVVVSCKKADIGTLVKWIKATFSSFDISIDGERATMLADFCLLDMQRIQNETNKIIDYLGRGGEVTESVIKEIVYKDADYKIFQMTDFVAQKKYQEAYAVIIDMLSRGETPIMILSSVSRYFRRLFFSAISGKTAKELASIFSIQEYAVTKIINLANKFKKISLKKAVDLLAEAEYAVKSGSVGADESMWISVFKIMND